MCKYGRPLDNESFAFLAALDPNAVSIERLPEQDALVVGYAAPSDSAWAGTLNALCKVLP